MRLTKEEKENLQKFIHIHYPQGKYDGHIHFATRKGIFLRNIGFAHQDILSDELPRKRVRKNQDYYLTKNTFTNEKRQADFLFSFLNIVIDVDMHQTVFSCIPDTITFLMGKLFVEDPTLIPNTVVKTGRGMQLWYSLESASYKLDKEYALVANHLCDRLQEVFSGGNTTEFTIDRACSCNAASLVRMPYSTNTKAGNRRVVLDIFHERKINLFSYIDENHLVKKKNTKKKPQKNLAAFREDMLYKLRMLRGDFQEGTRDLYIFALYCSCLGEMGQEKTMDRVHDFNKGFEVPLTEAELNSYLSAARRKEYRVSNNWIIKTLGITEEEQKILGFYPSGKARSKGKFCHLSEEQKAQIACFAQAGCKKREIAEKIGVSNSTVTRYMKENKILTQREIFVEKVHKLLAKGLSTTKTAKKLGVTRKEIDQIAYRFRKLQEKLKEEKERKAEARKEKSKKKERVKMQKEEQEKKIRDALINIHDTVHKEIDLYYKNGFEGLSKRQKERSKQWVHDVYDGIDLKIYNSAGMTRIITKVLEKEIIPAAQKKRKKEVAEEFGLKMSAVNRVIKKYHLDPEKEHLDELVSFVVDKIYAGMNNAEILINLKGEKNPHHIVKIAREKIASKRLSKQRKMLNTRKQEYRERCKG